jgi:DNA polymerase-3 subunit gamma/tau
VPRTPSHDDGPPPWDDGELAAARASAPTLQNAVPGAPPPVSAAPAVALAPTALGERWAVLVAELDRKQAVAALARELALQAELVAVDERATPPVWRLRVARESLRAAPPRDKLQAALAEHLGHALRLEVEAGAATDSPALRDAAERERRQREAEQIIHNDPVVQQLMSQFPTARIVPGSIKPHQTH